jgi:hypothetical protein
MVQGERKNGSGGENFHGQRKWFRKGERIEYFRVRYNASDIEKIGEEQRIWFSQRKDC